MGGNLSGWSARVCRGFIARRRNVALEDEYQELADDKRRTYHLVSAMSVA